MKKNHQYVHFWELLQGVKGYNTWRKTNANKKTTLRLHMTDSCKWQKLAVFFLTRLTKSLCVKQVEKQLMSSSCSGMLGNENLLRLWLQLCVTYTSTSEWFRRESCLPPCGISSAFNNTLSQPNAIIQHTVLFLFYSHLCPIQDSRYSTLVGVWMFHDVPNILGQQTGQSSVQTAFFLLFFFFWEGGGGFFLGFGLIVEEKKTPWKGQRETWW